MNGLPNASKPVECCEVLLMNDRLAAPPAIVVTCEHGGNHVPPRYRTNFAQAAKVLRTHRGYDFGALPLARKLSDELRSPLFFSETTRLLVDLNRSLNHSELFSRYSARLDERERAHVIEEFYKPYRTSVENAIAQAVPRCPVLHLSVHSFTPVLDNVRRETDIGLLFDPGRLGEARICERLRDGLAEKFSTFKVDFNKPYLGTDDGFTTSLRTRFSNEEYAGIELEINQTRFEENLDQQSVELSKAIAEVIDVNRPWR